MKLSQARKMRDGLLKGDSVMAQAWKELLDGSTGTDSPDEDVSSEERGLRTLKRLRGMQDEGAF